MTRTSVERVYEGDFVAEVTVELIIDENSWSPTLSDADARKLDAVRSALRRSDLNTASKLARIFRLLPISA